MKNFARAVRLALRRRFTVLGVLATSCLVALFWGGNIGAVYPFIEVVFRGDSMCDWVDNQAASAAERAARLEQEIAELQAQRAAAAPGPEREALQRALSFRQSRLAAERKALQWARQAQPLIHRYLPDDPFQTLLLIVAFVLAGTLVKDAFLIANMVLVGRLGQLTTMELRKEFYRRLLQMDLAAFGKHGSGALMSRLVADVNGVASGVTILFGKTLREPLKMIVCIAGAAMISWRLLVFSLIVTPAAFGAMLLLARSLRRANRRVLEEMARFFNRLAESLNGIQVVRAFTMERHERKRFHERVKQLYRKGMKLVWYNALARMNSELLGVCVICLAILAGGYLVLTQQTHLLGIKMTERPLSFGAMMVFYAFLAGVSDPARKLADVYSFLQRAAAAADRVYPLLDQEPSVRDPARPLPVPPRSGLQFRRVSFHYEPGRPVLTDVDLEVPAGNTLAIVGPNGCGKTTLVNLIPRFYDPSAGAVLLGGVDLRRLRLRDLRRRIGMVTQHTVLFEGTIRDNIRYGSLQASDEEVEQAARKARIDAFIRSLPQGYDTNIGPGGHRLSGGQRQRIALARAILRDPEILILDEATSQIDPESEQLIHQAVASFIRGRTTILITHRLSTLQLASRILVMDRGRITAVGRHEELLASCPVYERLHQADSRKTA